MRTEEGDVRTTLAIDDDVLIATKAMARQQNRSVGEIITDLARRSLRRRPAQRDCSSVASAGCTSFHA